ncbi:SDR family oxidoreductase [Paucibacter sp. B2R-40]|uniref:SDR family oxidoreductase n=1 Tax=Paucibacter sp. B2R-40 TaxID=2893554 RepID=UPI0021E4B8DD|nr:SDR family oxidoreductase [Paucibacter sp. B2R-40]MCV2357236.1 SDR family oxidoreductase [Paucibacter sp. B2R-40]
MSIFADFEAVNVGDQQSLVKPITEADIRRFVELTGDDNPLHVDPEYASETSFKEIVVHGMLGASFISTVIGTKLPGPGALWVSQSMEFNLPVRLGDTLTVTCTVLKKHPRERLLELDTRICNQHGQVVLSGGGKVKLLEPPRPKLAAAVARLKVAIVTGGAGGIGRAICEKLAAEGFAVVVNYSASQDKALKLVAKLKDGGAAAVAVQADVSTQTGAAKLVKAAIDHFGGVTVLVNAASPRIVARQIEELAWDEVQQHLDVQLKSALLMVQACKPSMQAAGGGRVISLGSQSWDGVPVAGWTAYAIAKGALSTLTRYLAAELGPLGITANLVSPGMTNTGFISGVSEKQQLMVARQTPLRRLAEPEDAAAAVAFLASEQAAYITGQNLRVNGGGSMAW